jgi:hypothetical protein
MGEGGRVNLAKQERTLVRYGWLGHAQVKGEPHERSVQSRKRLEDIQSAVGRIREGLDGCTGNLLLSFLEHEVWGCVSVPVHRASPDSFRSLFAEARMPSLAIMGV